MKKRNYIALILAAITLLACIASCGEQKIETVETEAPAVATTVAEAETQDPTKDENGYLKDSLDEKYDFGGLTLTTLYDTEVSMTDFFAEDTTGEAVNDALFARNAAVENRLGIKLEFVGEKGDDGNQNVFLKTAQNDVASGSPAYDMYAGYSRTIPLMAVNGLCADMLSTDYIDIEKPWWPEALTSECTINNKLLFCTGDISTNTLWMMSAVYYNKDMWTASNLGKTPEEMVQSNEWVLDKFIELAKNAYIDDGDGIKNNTDTFGLVAYNACLDGFLNFCGVLSVVKDSDGTLMLNPDFTGEKTETIVQKLGALYKSNAASNSSKSEGGRGIFYDGRALFVTDGTYIVATSGSKMDFEYGIVPGPKYDENQEGYVTNMRYPFNFYAINKMTDKKNECSCAIEAMASASYRTVTPVIFELTMKTRYSADEVTSQMYDLIRKGVVFDFGRIYGYCLGNYYPTFRNLCIAGGTGWQNNVSSIKKKTNTYLKKIYAAYED